MKLPRQLSLFSPPPLKLPSAILFRRAKSRFQRTSISTIARQPCPSHTSILLLRSPPTTPISHPHIRFASSSSTPSSSPSSTTTADSLIETLTDLYNTARDEFEIAAEETEKKSTYGPEDREAAHVAFDELKKAYDEAIVSGDGTENAVGKEVERRIGSRIRELEHALKNMDEMALED
jgi:hypothetical protein